MWEAIFLLVVLKVPVLYLCWVVWWAVRAKPAPPEPLEPALVPAPLEPGPGPALRGGRRLFPGARRPRHPRGSPRRTYSRRAAALARRRGKVRA